MDTIIFDQPRRGDVRCRNCAGEIEAYGEKRHGIAISGLSDYLWRHVQTGAEACPPMFRNAEPYDAWLATRLIKEAQTTLQDSLSDTEG